MLAKGPNALNLNAYTQGEQDYEQSQYPTNSQRPPIENSKSIQDQFDNFIKQLNKYDQILKDVAQDLDQLAITDPQLLTDFYPSFVVNTTYQNDQQKKIISSEDPELVKIVTNLQRMNKTYKQDIKGWTFQFAKKARLSQTLVSQNEILRKAICTKNEQLLKLMSTIENTQNVQISEMKQNLQILKQQNGLLLDHLKSIKQQLKERRQDETRLIKAFETSKEALISVQKQNRQIEDKQEHLSKSVALLQDNLDQILKRKKKLQKQKQRLTLIKQDYTKDQASIKQKVQSCQEQKNIINQQLKHKFQSNQNQKHKLIEQIQQLTEIIQKQKQQSRNLENQIQRNQNRYQEFNKINKELKVKSTNNAEIIEKLKLQHAKTISQQATYLSDIQLITNDVELLKQDLKKFDEIEKDIKKSNDNQIKSFVQNQNKVLAEQKNRQLREGKDLVKKIFEEKLQLSLKEKQMRDWELKIEQKKEEMKQLKSQIKQIRNNQLKLTEMKSKLSESQRMY